MGHTSLRLTAIAALVAVGALVSACGGTDVELKGGVFDAMGISGNMNSKRAEPEMAERQGLVVPPSTASLPKPGEPATPAVAANGEAFPVNPEDAKKAQVADVIAQHKAFCEQAHERYAAGMTQVVESSPWGACHESVMRNFTGKDLSGNKAVGAE